MEIKLYVVARTNNQWENAPENTVTKHVFDTEDCGELEKFLSEIGAATNNPSVEELETAARNFLQNEECQDWANRGVPSFIVSERELEKVTNQIKYLSFQPQKG